VHFKRALQFSPDHTLSQTKFKFVKKMLNAKDEGNALFKAGRLEEACTQYTKVGRGRKIYTIRTRVCVIVLVFASVLRER